MSTAAQAVARSDSSLSWIEKFLKEELAPYPGRYGLVGRMVLATTIVMIVAMTFQLSFAFQGAIIALLVSRESARSTLLSAFTLLLFTGLAAAYLLVSSWFVISSPGLHLLWVFASFFLAFFMLRALNNYSAAVIFSAIIAVGIPLWDRYVPAEKNVEDILRLVLVTMLGVTVTLIVELAFVHRKPGDQVVVPIVERLGVVAKFLEDVATGGPIDHKTAANLAQAGTVGTSRVRRILARSNYSPHFIEQMGALTALAGQIVDSVASWTPDGAALSGEDRKRMRRLAQNLDTISADLLARRAPHLSEPFPAGNASSAAPVLAELEKLVSLIPDTFIGAHPLSAYVPPTPGGDMPQSIFAWDTKFNSEHIKFALRGCLTASLCYLIYNLVDWQGISTSVTTCFLTALSTIGSSRQKQVLRFGGAAVGGFVFGMGSQIFILPHLHSIGGFTLLFMLVTALSSWVMTASARLSYFGLQMALAYYLINLQEFAFQTSLSIARDRVVGVLFGLIMMWTVFDQLGAVPAWVTMKKTFVASLRLQARLAREPVSTDIRAATETYFSLRETISEDIDTVRSLADGVLLEFGATREEGLAWRQKILAWQPLLRTLFLNEVALWRFRAKSFGFELPEPVRLAQRAFDDQAANLLDGMADRIEGAQPKQAANLKTASEQLNQAIGAFRSEHPQDSPQTQIYFALASRTEDLASAVHDAFSASGV